MNLSELQRKLFASARGTPPSDAVPYAFEKRIMAHLKGIKPASAWAFWEQSLPRAAACCVIFMLVLAAGAYFIPSSNSLSQDFEQTLFAAVDNGNVDMDLQ